MLASAPTPSPQPSGCANSTASPGATSSVRRSPDRHESDPMDLHRLMSAVGRRRPLRWRPDRNASAFSSGEFCHAARAITPHYCSTRLLYYVEATTDCDTIQMTGSTLGPLRPIGMRGNAILPRALPTGAPLRAPLLATIVEEHDRSLKLKPTPYWSICAGLASNSHASSTSSTRS